MNQKTQIKTKQKITVWTTAIPIFFNLAKIWFHLVNCIISISYINMQSMETIYPVST